MLSKIEIMLNTKGAFTKGALSWESLESRGKERIQERIKERKNSINKNPIRRIKSSEGGVKKKRTKKKKRKKKKKRTKRRKN